MIVSNLHATVTTLQGIFQDEAVQTASGGVDAVRQQAARLHFPDPEFAAQVFSFLAQKPGAKATQFSEADVSEAFLSLLMDDGVKSQQNPWVHTRSAIRNAAQVLGRALGDIDQVVRQTGMGFRPSIHDLASELEQVFGTANA